MTGVETALWTAADAARAVGAEAAGDWTATGVSIDTRTLRPGDLFVALTDVRDGHAFVAEALAKGAVAALVSRRPEGVDADAPLLVVPDVLAALGALARAARARTGARVIAVTGSAGKTSTKEMLRAMLAGQGRVHAAEASYNNHWGVPLTLARMPAEAEFAVIEIGMNHPGEIAPLAAMTRPHVALITTVAAAHLEAFEGIEAIAREKAAIFGGLEPGGVAVLPADLDTSGVLLEIARGATGNVIRFGASEGADPRLIEATLAGDTTVVRAERAGGPMLFKVAVAGRHFAMNALAALAVVEAAGADPGLAAIDLGHWTPPRGRGTRERLSLDPVEEHAIELIDDAFNANPASLSAALEVLAAARPVDDVGRFARGRRLAVLGDMLELGPDAAALHAGFAGHPAIAELTQVHCVGPLMAHLWEALPEHRRGRRADRAEDLAAEAHRLVDAGDVILVKGSKASRVSLVADAIRNLAHPRPTPR